MAHVSYQGLREQVRAALCRDKWQITSLLVAQIAFRPDAIAREQDRRGKNGKSTQEYSAKSSLVANVLHAMVKHGYAERRKNDVGIYEYRLTDKEPAKNTKKKPVATGFPFDIHPAADLFPMMGGEAFEEFVKDVQQNGVREPIIIWKGQLLDGRNRSAACLRLGMNPLDYACDLESEDVDPVAYVLSANLHRRHLDTTDKAKVALAVERIYAAEAKERQRDAGKTHGRGKGKLPEKLPEPIKGDSRDKAAEAVGISGRTLSDAKRVYESGNEEIIKAVDKKEMSISKAAKAIAPAKVEKEKPPEPKPRAVAKPEDRPEPPEESHDYDYPVVKAFAAADYRMNTLREIVKTLSHAERVILAGWLEESK